MFVTTFSLLPSLLQLLRARSLQTQCGKFPWYSFAEVLVRSYDIPSFMTIQTIPDFHNSNQSQPLPTKTNNDQTPPAEKGN